MPLLLQLLLLPLGETEAMAGRRSRSGWLGQMTAQPDEQAVALQKQFADFRSKAKEQDSPLVEDGTRDMIDRVWELWTV